MIGIGKLNRFNKRLKNKKGPMSMASNLDSIEEEKVVKRSKSLERKAKSDLRLSRSHCQSYASPIIGPVKRKPSSSVSYSRSRIKLSLPKYSPDDEEEKQ